MAKISGEYLLQSLNNVDNYTLAGNNRSAFVQKTEDKRLGWLVLSNGSVRDRVIDFFTRNKLHIISMRIITPGSPGLRCVHTDNVLRLSLYNVYDDEQVKKLGDAQIVELPYYNEWVKCDVTIEPYLITNEPKFTIGVRQWKFNIDDYNVQDTYLGKTVNFKVQMIVKTAGLLLDDRKI